MAKRGKTKTVVQKVWRPDFRNHESLPDTKVIRTDFLINAVGVLAAIFCLIWFGYREMELRTLAQVVKDLQTQVENATDSDRQSLDLNKKFVQNAEIVSEAIAFDTEPVRFHEFLAAVGDTLDAGLVLTNITMNHTGTVDEKTGLAPFQIELIGRVLENTPLSPAEMLEDFQKNLKELDVFADKSIEIDMSRFNRNNDFGYFDFTLLIKITVNKAPSL